MTSLGTILGIWAHPDDEVYLSGGLMAAARDAGQRVVCITATRGEHGTTDPERWPPTRLGALREHEQRVSLRLLGVHESHLLGIEDGRCAAEPLVARVDRLAAIIEQVRPDTILTFGPDGLTGHQDHQVVSSWATAARALAAPDAILLYATTTADHVDRWSDLTRQLDVFLVPELPLRRTPDELGFELQLEDELADRKYAALRAQASQTAGAIDRVGAERFRNWCATESFIHAENVSQRDRRTWRPTSPTSWTSRPKPPPED